MRLTADQVASIAAELEVLDPHDAVWMRFAEALARELLAGSQTPQLEELKAGLRQIESTLEEVVAFWSALTEILGVGSDDAAILAEVARLKSAQPIEPPGWRVALQFYADRDHFNVADDSAWDTVTGEPRNFWCDEAGTATVEDGTVAAMALGGTPLKHDDDQQQEAPTVAPLSTEQDRADAARYRWLRDISEPGICAFYLSVGKAFDGVKFARKTVDEAIDAQIGAQAPARSDAATEEGGAA